MDQSKLFDELHEQFQSIHMRKIDVKQNVLKRISQDNRYGEGKMKGKVGLIVAACMVFLVSSAYAAVKSYQLSNENGQVVYQARQAQEQENPQIMKPDPQTAQQQMLTLSDYTSFSGKITGFASIPNVLTDHFQFTKGVIFYDKTKRQQETIKTANAFYEYDGTKLILIVKKANPQEIVYTMPVTMEKVKLKENEAVYKAIASPNGTEQKQLTWIKGENMLFSLQTADEAMTKSELIKIAEMLQ